MHIITLGGDPGAGKSALAPRIANALSFAHLYVGDLFREEGKKRGMTIDEFYPMLANEPELEKQIDNRQVEFMRIHAPCVVQGRIAFHFAKQIAPDAAINVFLKVDPEVGAARQADRPEYRGKTIDEIVAIAKQRVATERERYRMLYAIDDHLDPNHFDIILDTSTLSIEATLAFLLGEIRKRLPQKI